MRTFENYSETKQFPHIYGETCFRCSVCNESKPTPSKPNGIFSGYAVRGEALICYQCAENEERENLKTDRYLFAYVSRDWKQLTTWSGGILGRVVSVGSLHAWSKDRRYISIIDVHGKKWHGVGSNGMYAKLKRSK